MVLGERAASDRPWRACAGLAACLLLGWIVFVQEIRVPILSLVDLGVHELGHLLTYPLPDVWTAAMGSIGQVMVPLALAAYFGLRWRDPVAGGICLAWAATSAQDASVYVADAPFQNLTLLGGEHDWAFVLGPHHLDMLESAGRIAALVRGVGFVLLLAAIASCAAPLLVRGRERVVARASSASRVRVAGHAPASVKPDALSMWK
jgi:hypothetical protein